MEATALPTESQPLPYVSIFYLVPLARVRLRVVDELFRVPLVDGVVAHVDAAVTDLGRVLRVLLRRDPAEKWSTLDCT